jgi:hypothetical protein
MTHENLYFAIGVILWVLIIIATPVFYGFHEARGQNNPDGLYFWGAALSGLVVPLWGGLLIAGLVFLIFSPVVKGLFLLGKRLAERTP